jgi:hypothetical protein
MRATSQGSSATSESPSALRQSPWLTSIAQVPMPCVMPFGTAHRRWHEKCTLTRGESEARL